MNTETKILIIEDEVLIADYLKELLDEEFSQIRIANTEAEARLEMVVYEPDIILMDINLGEGVSGIELGKSRNPDSKIIYITAQHDQSTMQKAIETSPETYITKPVKKTDLLAAVKIASTKVVQKYFVVKNGNESVKLQLGDILYMKSDKNYIDIFTNSRRLTVRQSFDSILQELDDSRFVKVHKSYIVNKHKINKATRTTLFIGEIEVPKSRMIKIEL